MRAPPDWQWKRRFRSVCRVAFLAAACATFASAQAVFVDAEGKSAPRSFSLPYAFANDGFGFAVGYVYGGTGIPQPQSSLIVTGIGGTEPAAALMVLGTDMRLPWSDRLFVDPFLSTGYYGNNDVYIDGNPNFVGQRAGSNDSDENNFIEGAGTDSQARARFRYVLPMGRGKDTIIDTYHVEGGLPIDGGERPTSLNPFTSGKTYLEVAPFYRNLNVDSSNSPDARLATNGLDCAIYWDNRDFFVNPSTGQSVRLEWIQDYGIADSSGAWTATQLEVDQYFPLGSFLGSRQTVLALDFWTSYSPSWDESEDGSIDNGPPPFYGSSLGGYWRMRAYPSQRFSDKAAIYYSAELRIIPDWNPFLGWSALQKRLGSEWVQLVPFVEVGRVAPEWDLSELNTDMKWDAGFGFRVLAQGLLLRVDSAVSDEGLGVRMMIGQSFQF